MVTAIRSIRKRAVQETCDQDLRIGYRRAGHNRHRTGSEQVTGLGAKTAGDHHRDPLRAEPFGKQAGSMLRCANNFFAQNIPLFGVRIYEQELFRMPKVLR